MSVLQTGSLVCQGHHSVKDLLELTFHQKPEVAFRASRVLEQVVTGRFETFQPCLGDFLRQYHFQENPSCRRHYGKIMAFLLENRGIPDFDPDPVIEATFDWLIDARTPVAVKVHCLEVLSHLSQKNEGVLLHHVYPLSAFFKPDNRIFADYLTVDLQIWFRKTTGESWMSKNHRVSLRIFAP